jgi:hypothetical protein
VSLEQLVRPGRLAQLEHPVQLERRGHLAAPTGKTFSDEGFFPMDTTQCEGTLLHFMVSTFQPASPGQI